ncbi:MAG: GTPase [Planctomycetaceae bacterium]
MPGRACCSMPCAAGRRPSSRRPPGTTRDWLRAAVTWHDCPLELLDTAGTEAATDEISIAAQDAGRQRIADADLVVWCTASDLSPAQQDLNVARRDTCARLTRQLLTITTKAELDPQLSERGASAVSAHTGLGLGELKSKIANRVDQRGQHVGELLGSTAARCRDSLRSARLAIGNAIGLLDARAGDELIAVELRAALEQTGQIAGQVTTDDVLDRIFSRFCIGK